MVMAVDAEVTRRGGLDMQVCVPQHWTDEQVIDYAEQENPCGTEGGWHIRRVGDPALAGHPERVQCLTIDRRCHITLDA